MRLEGLKFELYDFILRDYEEFVKWLEDNLEFFPALYHCKGIEQNNPYHKYDVFSHTMRALKNSPCDLIVRLAILFHDIGKPASKTTDENGIDHFYAHPVRSAKMASEILNDLGVETYIHDSIIEIILYHDAVFKPSKKILRRMFKKLGYEQTLRLLKVHKADVLGQSEFSKEERLSKIDNCFSVLEEIEEENKFINKF